MSARRDSSDVTSTFAALSDPTRRAVVERLRAGAERAGVLASELQTSRPAMSRHLKVLRRSGLIEAVQEADPEDARARVYRLRREPFDDMQQWLDRMHAYWTDQLDAFREHVERGRQ